MKLAIPNVRCGLALASALVLAPAACLVLAPAACLVLAPAASLAQKLAPVAYKAFVLYEFDVKDPAGFKSLSAKVRASLAAYKGEFLMREKVDSLFGGQPSNLSVISFPTVEDAKTWLASPDLAKLKAERDRVADVRTYLVEKVD